MIASRLALFSSGKGYGQSVEINSNYAPIAILLLPNMNLATRRPEKEQPARRQNAAALSSHCAQKAPMGNCPSRNFSFSPKAATPKGLVYMTLI